jgi:hypothetical protein
VTAAAQSLDPRLDLDSQISALLDIRVAPCDRRYQAAVMTGMHYCARASRGDQLLAEVYPYIYHLTRSVCHKPNYVVIALQQCCVTAALHPKVRKVVEAVTSLSILGRKGCNVAPDRLVEWINQFQQQRGGLGGEFDKKLHTGPALMPLLHATHVRHIAHAM